MMSPRITLSALIAVMVATLLNMPIGDAAELHLLNVSYDPTQEFYQQFNGAFAKYWQAKTGDTVSVRESHGGSAKQARAVIEGLDADVVTLALAYDIDVIAQKGKLLPVDWQTRLPNHSSPYTSTIVMIVRKGNPKGIKDWDDIARVGISVLVANPKTSGGARWAYLAMYGFALKANRGDDAKARAFVARVYRNVPVLDSGARGATITFAERGVGDVLLAWENEAHLLVSEFGQDKFQIIMPSVSILAEPPVCLVDKNVERHGTRVLAQAYLEYLYSEEGQDIAARNFYRPRSSKIAGKYAASFPTINLFTIDDMFGGWDKAQKVHFGEGGVFDTIYVPGGK